MKRTGSWRLAVDCGVAPVEMTNRMSVGTGLRVLAPGLRREIAGAGGDIKKSDQITYFSKGQILTVNHRKVAHGRSQNIQLNACHEGILFVIVTAAIAAAVLNRRRNRGISER